MERFFPEIDRVAVKIFRYLVGFTILLDALTKVLNTPWLYGSQSYVSIPEWILTSPNILSWPVRNLNDQGWVIILLIQAVCGLFLMVNRWPRAALLITLVIMRICLRRNGLAAHVGDLGFIFMCYWVLILPSDFFADQKTFHTKPKKLKSILLAPFVLQAACMFIFAGFYKLKHESWRDGLFFVRYAQYPEAQRALALLRENLFALKTMSYALPYLQVILGLLLILFFNQKKIRRLVLLTYFVFHLTGLWLSQDLTMFLMLWAPLCLLWPYNKSSEKIDEKNNSKDKKRHYLLAFIAGVLILSSNVASMIKYRPGPMADYQYFLSAIHMYQGWRVFDGAVTEKYVTTYKLKYFGEETFRNPQSSQKNFLIQNRYNSTRSASKSKEGHQRWLAGLCADEKRAGRQPETIQKTVEKRWFSDNGPASATGPQGQLVEQEEINCQKLEDLKQPYSHSNSARTKTPHE